MAKSHCRLLILVNHAVVAIFNNLKYFFYHIGENKILAKISELTVVIRGCSQIVDLCCCSFRTDKRECILCIDREPARFI